MLRVAGLFSLIFALLLLLLAFLRLLLLVGRRLLSLAAAYRCAKCKRICLIIAHAKAVRTFRKFGWLGVWVGECLGDWVEWVRVSDNGLGGKLVIMTANELD